MYIKQWPRRYEQVEQGSCADPEIFVRRGGGGGGGVEARRPENSLDNVFLVINLFYSLQSGSNGFYYYITCDFPEEPLTPSGSARGVA